MLRVERGVAGAADDVALGDRIETQRAVGEVLGGALDGSSRQAGRLIRAEAAAVSSAVGVRPSFAQDDQSRASASTRGSKRRRSLAPAVAPTQDLEQLGRDGTGVPAVRSQRRNSLSGS